VDLDNVLLPKKETESTILVNKLEFEDFAQITRKDAGDILIDGKKTGMLYSYAKCCNPIPGDPVIGYITVGEGIKIHRKTCNNLINLSTGDSSKLIQVDWPYSEGSYFVAGMIIKGEDRPGILNDIAHTIVSFGNTNIKSININANFSNFEGTITLYVNNLEYLNRLIERLKKVKGVYTVERFESM
jgi:GTP pyrophosphokinase